MIHPNRAFGELMSNVQVHHAKLWFAAANENIVAFKNSLAALTNTCNSYHHTVKLEFKKIKIPDSPPFRNQVIKK